MHSQRRLSKFFWFITLVTLLFILLLVYGVSIEPCRIKIVRVPIQNAALASVFRRIKAIHISDLHIGDSFLKNSQRVLEIVRENDPDIIFLTGDYVEWNGNQKAYDDALKFFSQLEAPLGVYAVMGDADYFNTRKSCEFCHDAKEFSRAAQHGVRFLRNSWVELSTGENMKAIIAGIDSEGGSQEEDVLLKSIPKGLPLIILSHTSTAFDRLGSAENVLMLAGDTHGGQIALPKVFWQFSRILPDPDHIYGLYEEGGKKLYVTSGVGVGNPPIRIGVPPEIVILEFVR